MSKDPAVLFYTSDFLTGTMTMTDEQVGKYIRLLCLQHQKGSLSEKDMLNICKSYDADVFGKFSKTEDGLYFNDRMKTEAERRKSYSESRAKNRLKKHMNNICNTYEKHMENENENENIDSNNISDIKVNTNNILSLVDKKIDSEVSDKIKPKKIATEKPLWFTDYNVYLESARNAYNNALNDGKLKERMQALYHNINYEGTLEVMFANYWGTEAGWQNKKKAKINTINWPATIRNGFSTKFNRIYFPKQTL